ncbi:MAG: leucyl/phenylalanyl-tRNA--protein transferase [Pseudomonadota bacterium]|nr:leucyl/phenylalanyl-tRNA--protein transferase [Pseudomonadota bacterium]
MRLIIPADTLLLAYRSGIFPMSDARDDQDVFWVEPRDRAILPLDNFHMSKSLRKVVRAGRYRVTVDQAFDQVIVACSQPRPGHPETWISDRIVRSYIALHQAGHAHSVECWSDDAETGEATLVGGLYGVRFDRVFCGESMFARADNASKVALSWLIALMRRGGFQLLDCQFMTDHLGSLGAVEMPQRDYLAKVERARGEPSMSLPAAYQRVLEEAGELPDYSPGKLIAQSLTQTS